jgi:hypothetical protein
MEYGMPKTSTSKVARTRSPSGRPKAPIGVRDSRLRLENGRIVGPTLTDPEVKRSLEASKAELRKTPDKLRARYVKSGLLTPGGKLTKTYGG